jgi:hypothetical protein
VLTHFFIFINNVELLEVFIDLVILKLCEITHAHTLIELLLMFFDYLFHLCLYVYRHLVELVVFIYIDVSRVVLIKIIIMMRWILIAIRLPQSLPRSISGLGCQGSVISVA